MKHAELDRIIVITSLSYETRKIQNRHTMINCFIGNFISAQDFWKATIVNSTFGNQLN